MANLVDVVQWEIGIYQLEVTDPVQGGETGVDNIPHKMLANRTSYLKQEVEKRALLAGSATQKFKVAAATLPDEAVTKAQLDAKTAYATALEPGQIRVELVGSNATLYLGA